MISKQDRDVYFDIAMCPIKSPCIDCNDRTAECHIKGNCRSYDSFKIKADAYRRIRAREMEKEKRFIQYKVDAMKRLSR